MFCNTRCLFRFRRTTVFVDCELPDGYLCADIAAADESRRLCIAPPFQSTMAHLPVALTAASLDRDVPAVYPWPILRRAESRSVTVTKNYECLPSFLSL